jgi:diguanylate cyclase (GGDEF)-like protein
MISIRRKIDESEHFALSFQALAKVFLGLANALPRAALPANPGLSEQCKTTLRRAAERLQDAPSRSDIDEAGATTLTQLDVICRANQLALEERDAALKDVVTTVAGAISGFRGRGERHESSLGKVADQFEALARIGDVNELRRQLHRNVLQLRQSVEEMRRESDDSVRQFESQIQVFEQRLEAARKGSGTDRLTGLGSRREAERQLQKIPKCAKPVCLLLFDIEGFRDINARFGTIFGDKLLQALAHTLKSRFPDEGTLFRWGADEFLVIAEGKLGMRADQCRGICEAFAGSRYTTFEGSKKTAVSALLAGGAAQYTAGETMEDLYRRARESLERARASLPR